MSNTQNNKNHSQKDSNKYPKNCITLIVSKIHFITLILIGILGGFIGSYLFFYLKPSISIPIVTNTQDIYTIHLNLLEFYLAFIAIVLTGLTFLLAWKISDIQSKSEKIQQESQRAFNEIKEKAQQEIKTAKESFQKIQQNSKQAVETAKKSAEESNYSLLVNQGISYANQNNFTQATESFKKAIDFQEASKFKKNDATAYNNLGTIYANDNNPNQNFQEAIKNLQQAITLNPNDATAYYNLGTIYAQNQDFPQAIASLQKAITLNPNDATAYYNLGTIYAQNQDFPQAIACYQNAIKLNKNYAEAYNNLGNTYANPKNPHPNFQEAITSYQNAISLNPNYAKAYYNLGTAYAHANNPTQDFAQAIESFKKAIALNPNDATAYNNLGNTYADPKNPHPNFQEAITSYQNAISLNPNYAKAYYNLGMLHWIIGTNNQSPQYKENIAQAEKNFKIAINLNPSLSAGIEKIKKNNS